MKYRTIVADPPWELQRGGPMQRMRVRGVTNRDRRLEYPTMAVEDIAVLPVAALAEDDAHLYLWTVNAHLEASYGVARAWGFRPVQMLVWAKAPRGIGLGGAFTSTTEFLLFARRGSLATMERTDTSWWNWKRPEAAKVHSAKPDGALDLIERVSPGPYVELFARRARMGWDYWGDESLGTAEMPERLTQHDADGNVVWEGYEPDGEAAA